MVWASHTGLLAVVVGKWLLACAGAVLMPATTSTPSRRTQEDRIYLERYRIAIEAREPRAGAQEAPVAA